MAPIVNAQDKPNDVFGVKWRDWKLHFKEHKGWNGVLREYTMPRDYNVINDPQERDNVLFPHTWVPKAALPQLEEHVISLRKYPPIKAGQKDPYEPPRKRLNVSPFRLTAVAMGRSIKTRGSFMLRTQLVAISVLAILAWCPAALADVLYLKNGDQITGTIKRIWDQEVTIEPEYSDKFQVDLPMIERIESDRDFEIEMPDGSDVVAKMQGVDNEGNQILVVDGESVAVALGALREVAEPEDYSDWEFLVDYSFSLNEGNTDSVNSRLAGEGMFKRGDHRHIGTVTQVNEEQDRVTTKEQTVLAYGYNWFFTDPWFFAANGQFERDPIRELDQRVTASAGVGRDIWNEPNRFLTGQLGLGLTDEEIGLEKETSTVAAWSLRFRHEFFSDDFEVFHDHSIVYTIDGRDNTVIKTSTGIRYEITDLLYLNVSLDWDHEAEPAGTAEKTDTLFVVGAGLEFD